MFRLKSNPKLIVRKVAEGFHRIGSKLKTEAVCYVSEHDQEITMRAKPEFERLFERLE